MDDCLVLRTGTCSERGTRQRNEDFCLEDVERQIFVVSDGVGGMPYGGVMAQYCCYAALDCWIADPSISLDARLRTTFDTIGAHAAQTSHWLGDRQSSATLLLCVIEGRSVGIASVGDCAAYLVRGDTCTSLVVPDRPTQDSHYLTQAMGLPIPLKPSLYTDTLEDADILLLCTDGAWERLDTDDVPSLCSELEYDEGKIARQLCRCSDGSDNATALVIGAHVMQPASDSDSCV